MNTGSASHRARAVLFAITVIYWLGLFIATHLPPTRIPRARFDDKLAHFAAYAVLATLLLASLRQIGFSPQAASWWVVLICLTYGAVDEWSQIFVGRLCSFDDWYADAAGALTVAGLAMVIGAYREARGL